MARPGVFEVPVGLPLGELLLDPRYCGGIVGGTIKAIAPSGPSSGLLPPILRLVAPVPGEDRYEKWLADAVGRLRTPEEQAVLKGFVERHLPPGATALELRHVPLDLSAETALGILKLAVQTALTAPTGPVSVEIPIDIQAALVPVP